MKTSTPRESIENKKADKNRNDSDSSGTLSNEEIVRKHLSTFNQTDKRETKHIETNNTKKHIETNSTNKHIETNNTNLDVNMNFVTAKEKRRQYNKITEKYVNNAIKEEVIHNINEDVKPLDVKETENIQPVVVDPEGYQAAVAARRELEVGLDQKNLMSHTEIMKEHFKDDHFKTADCDSHTNARLSKVGKAVSKTASEKNILESQHFNSNNNIVGQTVQNIVREDVSKTHMTHETTKHVDNDNITENNVRKKYIITQQEIVFYIRNADGTIRIVNRPLVTGEKEYGTLRKRRNSQPNLEQEKDEAASGAGGMSGGVPGHIVNVGNINLESETVTQAKHPQVLHVQNKEWKSSGSIFDCEQGCFSDETVVI